MPPADAKITETRTEGRSGLLLAHAFGEASGGWAGCLEDSFTRGEKKLPLPRLESGSSGLEFTAQGLRAFSHASGARARQRVPALPFSFTPSSGEPWDVRAGRNLRSSRFDTPRMNIRKPSGAVARVVAAAAGALAGTAALTACTVGPSVPQFIAREGNTVYVEGDVRRSAEAKFTVTLAGSSLHVKGDVGQNADADHAITRAGDTLHVKGGVGQSADADYLLRLSERAHWSTGAPLRGAKSTHWQAARDARGALLSLTTRWYRS